MKPFSIDLVNTSVSGTQSEPVDLRWGYVAAVDTSWAMAAIPAAFDVDTGEIDQYLWNFADIGTTGDGDFVVLEDATGTLWAAALDADGSGVTNAGPVWTSIAAGKKVVVDVSALTDDEDIAAAVVAALNGLTGFTAKFTLTDNADGTVLAATDTQFAGTQWGTFNSDESGAGSTTVSVAAGGGVNPTFHTDTDVIDAIDHGLLTGMAVRVAIDGGSLPSPLAAGVDYFAIKLTDDTFKLAASYANAVAGSALNLTTEGTDNQTVTFTAQANSASLLIEYSPDVDQSEAASPRWRTLATVDLDSGTSPTTTAISSGLTPPFHFVRATMTILKGAMSTPVRSTIYGKNV